MITHINLKYYYLKRKAIYTQNTLLDVLCNFIRNVGGAVSGVVREFSASLTSLNFIQKLGSASFAHSVKSKSRKNFAKIKKKKLRRLQFSFFSLTIIGYYIKEHTPKLSWADQNVRWKFQIVRLSLADFAHHLLKLNIKEVF